MKRSDVIKSREIKLSGLDNDVRKTEKELSDINTKYPEFVLSNNNELDSNRKILTDYFKAIKLNINKIKSFNEIKSNFLIIIKIINDIKNEFDNFSKQLKKLKDDKIINLPKLFESIPNVKNLDIGSINKNDDGIKKLEELKKTILEYNLFNIEKYIDMYFSIYNYNKLAKLKSIYDNKDKLINIFINEYNFNTFKYFVDINLRLKEDKKLRDIDINIKEKRVNLNTNIEFLLNIIFKNILRLNDNNNNTYKFIGKKYIYNQDKLNYIDTSNGYINYILQFELLIEKLIKKYILNYRLEFDTLLDEVINKYLFTSKNLTPTTINTIDKSNFILPPKIKEKNEEKEFILITRNDIIDFYNKNKLVNIKDIFLDPELMNKLIESILNKSFFKY